MNYRYYKYNCITFHIITIMNIKEFIQSLDPYYYKLGRMTVPELMNVCNDKGLSFRSNMSNKELIQLIKEYDMNYYLDQEITISGRDLVKILNEFDKYEYTFTGANVPCDSYIRTDLLAINVMKYYLAQNTIFNN